MKIYLIAVFTFFAANGAQALELPHTSPGLRTRFQCVTQQTMLEPYVLNAVVDWQEDGTRGEAHFYLVHDQDPAPPIVESFSADVTFVDDGITQSLEQTAQDGDVRLHITWRTDFQGVIPVRDDLTFNGQRYHFVRCETN